MSKKRPFYCVRQKKKKCRNARGQDPSSLYNLVQSNTAIPATATNFVKLMFSCQGGFDSALWKCIYKAVLYSRLDHITQNTHYHRIRLMQLLQRAHTLQHTFLNNIFYDELFVLRHLQCIYLLTPNTVSVNSTFCPTDITNVIVPE